MGLILDHSIPAALHTHPPRKRPCEDTISQVNPHRNKISWNRNLFSISLQNWDQSVCPEDLFFQMSLSLARMWCYLCLQSLFSIHLFSFCHWDSSDGLRPTLTISFNLVISVRFCLHTKLHSDLLGIKIFPRGNAGSWVGGRGGVTQLHNAARNRWKRARSTFFYLTINWSGSLSKFFQVLETEFRRCCSNDLRLMKTILNMYWQPNDNSSNKWTLKVYGFSFLL